MLAMWLGTLFSKAVTFCFFCVWVMTTDWNLLLPRILVALPLLPAWLLANQHFIKNNTSDRIKDHCSTTVGKLYVENVMYKTLQTIVLIFQKCLQGWYYIPWTIHWGDKLNWTSLLWANWRVWQEGPWGGRVRQLCLGNRKKLILKCDVLGLSKWSGLEGITDCIGRLLTSQR